MSNLNFRAKAQERGVQLGGLHRKRQSVEGQAVLHRGIIAEEQSWCQISQHNKRIRASCVKPYVIYVKKKSSIFMQED